MIHDRTATLTPRLDPRQAVYQPRALPVAVAGQLFVTAPIAVAAAIQYFMVINEPLGSPAT